MGNMFFLEFQGATRPNSSHVTSLARFGAEILLFKTKFQPKQIFGDYDLNVNHDHHVHHVYLVHHDLHDCVGDKHPVCRGAESVTRTY